MPKVLIYFWQLNEGHLLEKGRSSILLFDRALIGCLTINGKARSRMCSRKILGSSSGTQLFRLDPEASAFTMRPPHLPQKYIITFVIMYSLVNSAWHNLCGIHLAWFSLTQHVWLYIVLHACWIWAEWQKYCWRSQGELSSSIMQEIHQTWKTVFCHISEHREESWKYDA